MPRQLNFYAFYPGDYRAKTRHLTREEHFAFREIMDEIFMTDQDTCRIADDDDYLRSLARATPDEWATIRKTLIDGPRALLRKRGQWIYSPRLTEEIEKAKVKSDRNRENAKARWSDRNATGMRTHSERTEVAMPVESESELEKRREETETQTTSSSLSEDADAAEVVSTVLRIIAPNVKVSEATITKWLKTYCRDPWQIAATICEKELYVADARTAAYVASVLAERKTAKGGFDHQDPREYVTLRLSARRQNREGYR